MKVDAWSGICTAGISLGQLSIGITASALNYRSGFKRSASTSFLGAVAAQPNSCGKFGQDFLRTVFDRIRKKGVLRWASILGKVGRPR